MGFNAETLIGIGGPSVGNGMLFVTTGQTFTIGNAGGGIIAFGLPTPPPQTKREDYKPSFIFFFIFVK